MSFRTNMCFTCLRGYGVKLFPINELDTDNISYLQKLVACMPNVVQNDSMIICRTCVKYLRTSYKFRELVLRSQETWATYSESCQKIILAGITENDVNQIVNEKFDENLEDFIIPKDDLIETTNVIPKEEDLKTITDDIINIAKEDLLQNTDNAQVDILHQENLEPPPIEDNLKESDEKQEDFLCDFCDCRFLSKDEIASHVCEKLAVTKEKVAAKTVVCCDMCSMVFNKVWKYTRHVRKVHTTERKYRCSLCEKSFKQAYHLREHMTIHTGEKNFSCPVCDKLFQRASSQRRHLKSHQIIGSKTKKTPYLCNICGKSFPYSNGAQRHMRTHTGERKFECEICNRKFSQSTHLHVHMRVHTGEKPYVCDCCGDSFSLKATLSKHLKGHDKLKDLQEIVSEVKTPDVDDLCDVKGDLVDENDSEYRRLLVYIPGTTIL